MNKTERDELRRLLRSQFKVLRADVAARKAELDIELADQVEEQFKALDKQYDDAMYQLSLAVDEANRKANDIGRELWGREKWGETHDRTIIQAAKIERPGVKERHQMIVRGRNTIEQRVTTALLELDRRENRLLLELATSALESAESLEFFSKIPAVSELVPAYRLQELIQ
jgi:hypothetical protein